ncbi:MAG: hypothetical protein JRG91_13875 [Deltaproteobacteria bacterium]|nr:hypothetical protein [Deltaproteobacteria bacterium]
MNVNQEKKGPGCIWPALWGVAAVLGTIICAAVVGIMAADSESAGVTATYIVAFPFGALWSGAIAALIVQFVGKDNKGVRYGVPPGCGCLGGLALLFMIFFFFVAIFPAL